MAKAIGIFDSGIGGLTVASAIKHQFPNQPIIYFGDTLHLPYGDKSPQSIKSYIRKIAKFLYEAGCSDLVVACNSASSVMGQIQELPNFRQIINVIDPVVEQIAISKDLRKVGVIGTKRTIKSGVYGTKIKQLRPDIEVVERATPLLAPMIEEGFIHGEIAHQVVHAYLEELRDVDALILGCTHYPLIKKEVQDFLGPNVQLFDAPDLVANQITDDINLETNPDKFYVSDYTTSFEKTAQRFFGEAIHLEKCTLFDY